MKALLVNGSPRPRGCTYTALTELKKTLEAEGIEVELLHVGNKDIRGCIACRKCAQTGKCVFDDVVNEVAPKLAEADAFVIGCPVYFASPAGGAVSFIHQPPLHLFLYYIIHFSLLSKSVEKSYFHPTFPTSWIYGKEPVFLLKFRRRPHSTLKIS